MPDDDLNQGPIDIHEEERRAIREALQQTAPELGDAVVTNWIVVAERMDGDGERHLTQFSGDAADQCPAYWLRVGMLDTAAEMIRRPDEEDADA